MGLIVTCGLYLVLLCSLVCERFVCGYLVLDFRCLVGLAVFPWFCCVSAHVLVICV